MGSIVDLSTSLRCLKHLFVKIRSKDCQLTEFKRYADRIMSLIVEEGLSHIQCMRECVVQTPTGCDYNGCTFNPEDLVLISIIRAGDSMLDIAMKVVPEASVGKILIQRNEVTAKPILYYSKLPHLRSKTIIVLDPMLATGGSAKTAIDVLLSLGASEENMLFFCVVSCPEGVRNLTTNFPKLTLVTGEVDERLNEKKYIIPGLGDYGDRYYGT